MSVLSALLLASVVAADGGSLPCRAPEHRQFDFWLGPWEVTGADAGVLGTNEISSELNGCVLHEHWRGARGSRGESFNAYDAVRRRWHQTWVDDSGGLLLLEGGLVSGQMVLSNPSERISYAVLPDGRVRQLWEHTSDGQHWTVTFEGFYARARR